MNTNNKYLIPRVSNDVGCCNKKICYSVRADTKSTNCKYQKAIAVSARYAIILTVFSSGLRAINNR